MGVRLGVGRDNERVQEPREGCDSPKELQAPSARVESHPSRHLTGACVCVNLSVGYRLTPRERETD